MQRLNLPAGIDITIVQPDEPVVPDPAAAPAKRNRRHDNRVAAVQFLCAWESQRHADLVTALFDFLHGREQGREYFAFAEELIHGVIRDVPLIDEVVTIGNETAFATARRVARLEGIPVGISSGAAVAAALEVAQRSDMVGKTIVAIIPSFAERYLSTALFDGL